MEFIFRGGHPALDFLNTEIRDARGNPADLLDSPAALAEWLTVAGFAVPHGGVSPETWRESRAFRSALRAVVAARVEDRPVASADVERVNAVLRSGGGYFALAGGDGGLRRVWDGAETGPHAPLLPLARAALDLVTGEQAGRVRQCGGPGCILYFLDTSKNRARRWCSMDACGNRMKAATHYRRKKQSGADGA
jgi:predicted RNA-binding Zn ribbon-like protein